MEKPRRKKESFRRITIVTSLLSAILWVSAGSIAVATSDFYSYSIVGILALLSGMVAVNSARKEGGVRD